MRAIGFSLALILVAGTALAQTVAIPGGINQATVPPSGVTAVAGGVNQAIPAPTTTTTSSTGTTTTGTTNTLASPFIDGGGGYNYGYKATTAGEGYLRGGADVIRSKALYGLAASQAAINYSQARQANLRTSEEIAQWNATYQDYLRARRPPRPSEADLLRVAKARLPERLGPADVNPGSGQVSWPSVLMEATFAPLRAEIERLMAERAASRQLNLEEYLRLDESINELQYLLAQRIRQYPPDLYLAGNRFLSGLRYESTLAPTTLTTQVSAVPPAEKPWWR